MHPSGKIIVTEFMEHGSLNNLLTLRVLLPLERVKIAKDIALGLKYLHSQNVLHRDLTSKNILLSKSMEAKVADFGLSKQKLEGEDLSYTMGSVPWMAPEVLLNANSFTDKSDVYSLGIILWELWARTCPCPSDMPHHHFARLVYAENYRPAFPNEVPEKWSKIIQLCWAPDPTERPIVIKIVEHLMPIEQECIVQASPRLHILTELNTVPPLERRSAPSRKGSVSSGKSSTRNSKAKQTPSSTVEATRPLSSRRHVPRSVVSGENSSSSEEDSSGGIKILTHSGTLEMQ